MTAEQDGKAYINRFLQIPSIDILLWIVNMSSSSTSFYLP